MFNTKTKLYFCIAGELGAGVILLMSAVQTFPVKYSQQVQVDKFRGQISNPANVGSPFAPFLGLMGIACFGDGLRRFWQSFEDSARIPIQNKVRYTSNSEDEFITEEFPVEPEVAPTVAPTMQPPTKLPTYKPKSTPTPTRLPINSAARQPRQESHTELQAYQSVTQQIVTSQPEVIPMKKKKAKTVPTFDIENFAGNKLSIVFAGAPRTGKTTSHLVWIAKKFEADPNVQFRIVTQKKNRFLGLDQVPGVVQRVSRSDSYSSLFWQTLNVWEELQERLGLDEGEERDSLSEYWLVLDDWFSIVANLEKSTGDLKKCWENCKCQFSDIVTLGAEVGVGISVNTHTLNLAHLGLAEDANIRSVLSICAMGRIHIETKEGKKRKEGGFDAITNVLKNSYIIDEEYSADLRKKFTHLREYSSQTGLPVVVSTMGEPEINIMPDLSWIKEYKIPVDQAEVAQYFENLMQVESSNGIQENDDYWQEQETDYQNKEEELANGENCRRISFPFNQNQSLDFHQDERFENETGEDDLAEEDYQNDIDGMWED